MKNYIVSVERSKDEIDEYTIEAEDWQDSLGSFLTAIGYIFKLTNGDSICIHPVLCRKITLRKI